MDNIELNQLAYNKSRGLKFEIFNIKLIFY